MSVLTNVELIMWNLPGGEGAHPTTQTVKEHMSANGMNPDRAAPIPDSTAFRRAADGLRDKSTLVRCYDRKNDDGKGKLPACQIDRETQTEDGLDRARIGTYIMATDSTGAGIVMGHHGADMETKTKLREAFDIARVTYTWGDCSKAIQEVLTKDGLGAYSPRKSGGVYFAPVNPQATDLLDRLDRFASALGIRFLRYTVPDTQSQRAEVADALALGISGEIETHAQAIATYSTETRPGIIENRLEAITATETLTGRLAALLGTKAEELNQRTQALRTLAQTALEVAQQARPAHAGRRIVQTA